MAMNELDIYGGPDFDAEADAADEIDFDTASEEEIRRYFDDLAEQLIAFNEAQAEPVAKGDHEGHPFHGNQYERLGAIAGGVKEALKPTREIEMAQRAVKEIAEKGGVTIKLGSGFQPKNGWIVSLPGHEEVLGSVEEVTPERIAGYLARHGKVAAKKGNYLGGWVDDGKVYLDVSTRKSSESAAVKEGVKGDQIAITHLVNGEPEFMYLKGPQSNQDHIRELLLAKAGGPIRFYLEYTSTTSARSIADEIKRIAGDVSKDDGPPCIDCLEKGDRQGHPFHGNQYVAVGGGLSGSGAWKTKGAVAPKDATPAQIKDAQRLRDALLAGKKVEVSRGEVATLIDQLAQYARDCKKKGIEAKDFDLCKITVPGSNMFCSQNLNIPRDKMPQFSGKPRPGTKAAKLRRNAEGDVDAASDFRHDLESQGIKVKNTTVVAAHLKATQRQLVGPKVAGIMGAISSGKMDAGSVFVSRDNYVLDGHHRWAAVVGNDLTDDGQAQSMRIKVIQVDMDIADLLPYSQMWAENFGIAPKAGRQKGGS